MSFDNSRFTFDPRKDYSGVVMQQGRVQLDSDWNEWLAELTRRTQAGTLDILGRAVYPATTPHAFEITASNSGGTNTLLIGPGRMYVDGLLAENHGDGKAVQWDPALAEMSNAPQPPLPSATTGAIDYTVQPYMPPKTELPSGNGPFLAYLDVWVRPVDYINDPDLIDAAVGVDSTGRLQTVWQVRLKDLNPGTTCDTPIEDWPPPPSGGLLSTDTTPTAPSGPCCLTSGAAYTGLENQFYRVEINRPGTGEASAVPPAKLAAGIATFKWSRDNGSVITGVTSITSVTNSAGKTASQLAVQSLGRDQVLGFAPGNWIEIVNDSLEFNGQPGELHQIDTIDFAARTITLVTPLGSGFPAGDSDPSLHTRIRRWDQSGKVYEQDGTTVWWDIDAQGSADIPVPPTGTWLILENGITVNFDLRPGTTGFNTGDFWTFAARTATGQVEKLHQAAPRGIHHHYARLSIVNFPSSASDCRTKWTPSGGGECGCCCTCTVGPANSSAKYTSINDAINALENGGEVCILPGQYFENVVIRGQRDVVLRGCGWQTRIASASLKPQPSPAVAAAVAPHEAAGAVAAGAGAAATGAGATGTAATGAAATGAVATGTAATGAAATGTAATGAAATGAAATGAAATGVAATGTDNAPFAAVITILQSQHVKLLSFAVEAADGEVGVLIDGTGKLSAGSQSTTAATDVSPKLIIERGPAIDVTVEDLVITASTVPAILADTVTLLQIESNRIAMKNVAGSWPAVWVSGTEIRITHNWLGIQSQAVDLEWLPGTVQSDIAKESQSVGTGLTSVASFQATGGIQIGGMSGGAATRDVFIIENEIDGAGRNGVTLGSLAILDSKGNNTGGISGTTVQVPGPCDTTTNFQIPASNPSLPGSRLVAAGRLINVQINRNRIRNTGACGIGPVGFFDLNSGPEIVSIQNLTISANTIAGTLRRKVTPLVQTTSGGFGAICVPFVEDLAIRDNAITDFGSQPGDPVCGIFVLYGQIIDISRNQVLETRDWNLTTQVEPSSGVIRGGIVVLAATPPSFTNTGSIFIKATPLAAEYAAPLFVPGVPALRVEHNVVRVASGDALEAGGFGPFSIVNNHLATAGTRGAEGLAVIAQTVLILNLGIPIELASQAGKFSSFAERQTVSTSFLGRDSATLSSGAVTFTNNMCQLEARVSEPQALSSVTIVTLDDLIFGNNQCWLDASRFTAYVDALLVASFLQATSNRFQEAAGFPVAASAFTIGALNITGQNISTYCLFATGISTSHPALKVDNLSLVSSDSCDSTARSLNLNFK